MPAVQNQPRESESRESLIRWVPAYSGQLAQAASRGCSFSWDLISGADRPLIRPYEKVLFGHRVRLHGGRLAAGPRERWAAALGERWRRARDAR
eukprot:4092802-Heterocapsa_arctica.AAC.2